MTLRMRFVLIAVAIVLATLIGACSDDNPTTSPPDTTPPSVTSVTTVDALHIDVLFSEALARNEAEDESYYVIVETNTPSPAARDAWTAASPGDTLHVANASLKSDNKTVLLTTEAPMAAVNYRLTVTGVEDTHGNSIDTPVDRLFTGSTAPDLTAPEIVSRTPAPDATGVAIGAPLTVVFSEPVTYSSFTSGLTWTSGSGDVTFVVDTDDLVHFAVQPVAPLALNTVYTVTLTGVQDLAANSMSTASWSFRTTNTMDTTPPTLVSTSPANLATNVDVNTNLSLTFSEAVNQEAFEVTLIPEPGSGVDEWSNAGKTVTFNPDNPLLDNQQYNLFILPGGVQDLSGNGIATAVNVVFTTGSSLESGSFAGTLSGDANSENAKDPTGALVVAADAEPFGGAFNILGSAVVAGNNTYTISHLPDGVYYPIAVLDSNHDGIIDPSNGDAIGAYGVDFSVFDLTVDSVEVAGGSHETGIDFPLYDPSTISGSISYSGDYAAEFHYIYIGLFDTSGFDPSTSVPLYGTIAFWPDYPDYFFSELDGELADDDYYVAAFLDVNNTGSYEPITDPAGLYGGSPPTIVHVEKGIDAHRIDITLQDPLPGLNATAVHWKTAPRHAPWVKRLSDAVRQSQVATKK